MSEANKEIVRRANAAINQHDFEALAAIVADDFVEHDETPGFEPTKAGSVAFARATIEAFPDFHVQLEDIVAEGDKVFMRATLSGTQNGTFMGIPPSGRRFSVPVGDFLRLEDGLVKEHWGVSDVGSMMQQLGVTGMPGSE